MPREIVTCNLQRKTSSQPWGFRIVGGTDEALILKVDKVHGAGSPAGQAQLQANDAIIFVDDKDVTDLKHHEVVNCIKACNGLNMKIMVERGDHVIPSISEAFPNPENVVKELTREEKLAYYEMAMQKGLQRFLIPDNFTSVGKMRVKTPKHNSPRQLYSDETMDDMVSGSTVDPTKLDPDSDAYKKWAKSKKFDPAKSGVMEVLRKQSEGNFSVDKRAIKEAQMYAIMEQNYQGI